MSFKFEIKLFIFICVSCSVFSFNSFFSWERKSEFCKIISLSILLHKFERFFALCFTALESSKPVLISFTLLSEDDKNIFKYF